MSESITVNLDGQAIELVLEGGAAEAASAAVVAAAAAENVAEKVVIDDDVNFVALHDIEATPTANQVVLGNDEHDHAKMFGITMARWDGGVGRHNLSLGGAGRSSASWTGQYTLGIGEGVFGAATTASTSVGIGQLALSTHVTGNGNTAVGMSAMRFSQTCGDCTVVGSQAGEQAVSGIGNTIVGFRAGQYATVARNCTFLGDSAGWREQALQTVHIGYRVAEFKTSGDYTITIGSHCALNRADGTRCIFIGNWAGSFPDAVVDQGTGAGAIAAGDYNIGIGWESLKQTTGDGHTALGDSSGAALTSGSNGIFIGRDAGAGGTQKVDGANQIVIGYGANATLDNQAVLGSSTITQTNLYGRTIIGHLASGVSTSPFFELRPSDYPAAGKSGFRIETHQANGWHAYSYDGTTLGAGELKFSFGTVVFINPFGYGGLGSGGTVTQATSKSTAVTLNKATGQITMNNAALAAGAVVSFPLNNSLVAATDQLIVTHHSGGTIGEYHLNGRATGSGTAEITVKNLSAGSLSEAIVLKYSLIKSSTS